MVTAQPLVMGRLEESNIVTIHIEGRDDYALAAVAEQAIAKAFPQRAFQWGRVVLSENPVR